MNFFLRKKKSVSASGILEIREMSLINENGPRMLRRKSWRRKNKLGIIRRSVRRNKAALAEDLANWASKCQPRTSPKDRGLKKKKKKYWYTLLTKVLHVFWSSVWIKCENLKDKIQENDEPRIRMSLASRLGSPLDLDTNKLDWFKHSGKITYLFGASCFAVAMRSGTFLEEELCNFGVLRHHLNPKLFEQQRIFSWLNFAYFDIERNVEPQASTWISRLLFRYSWYYIPLQIAR